MSTVLSNGVIVPDVGSTNWAADLETNWTLLNALIGAIGANVRLDRPNIWTAVQTFSGGIYGDLDGTAARAVSDADGNEIATTYALKTEVTALATAVSGKAADNAVVHLAGAETITGDKTWTGRNTFQYTVVFKDAAAVSAGGYGVGLGFFDYAGNRYGYIQPHITSDGTKNITFGNSASGYLEFTSPLVPYASGVLSLGANGFRWNGIYDANSIFVYNAYIFGTAPSNNKFWGLWNRDSTGVEVVGFLACARTSGHNSAWVRCLNTDGTNTYDRHVELTVGTNGVTQFIPNATDVFDLGGTSAKWKTLNGINPGALSFPANSYIAIDTTNFNKSGGLNTYTPPSNGWIGIQAASVSYNASYYVFIGRYTDGTTANPSYWSQGQVSPLMANFDGYMGQVFIPVIGGKLYHIRINGDFSTGGSIKAYFFPCLGNV